MTIWESVENWRNDRFVNGFRGKSCRKSKFYEMCTKIRKLIFPRRKAKYPQGKLWIMWITWCISAFYRKKGIWRGGQLSTISLWIMVDKVDKGKIECMICAICLVYHNFAVMSRSCPGNGESDWMSAKKSLFKQKNLSYNGTRRSCVDTEPL